MNKTVALPILALVGRPNVGKSTLFNVLSTGGKAVVHNAPGTTRDTRRTPGALGNLRFELLDTAGMEITKESDELAGKMTEIARRAADKADVLLLVIDGAVGPLPSDEALASMLRRLGKPIISILTKADLSVAEDNIPATIALGFGEPVLLSAAHRMGLDNLTDVLAEYCPTEDDFVAPEPEEEPEETEGEESEDDSLPDNIETVMAMPDLEELPDAPLKLAIVGRPNTGKSTLVNALLKEDAMLTGPMAGLTRDAVSHSWTWDGQAFELIDTPGLRKKTRVTEELEEQSVGQTLKAIEQADIVLMLLDASTYSLGDGKWQIFEQQDTKIAHVIQKQNKPLLVGLTKWDLLEEKNECLADTLFQLSRRMNLVKQPMAVPLNAPKGQGIGTLLKELKKLNTASRKVVSTSKLNKQLMAIIAKRPPPIMQGKMVNLKFIRQLAANPPMIGIWGNRVNLVSDSYQSYIRNSLGEGCGWEAVPLKIIMKAQKNPYSGKRSNNPKTKARKSK